MKWGEKGWFISKKNGLKRQAGSTVLCSDQGTNFPLNQERVTFYALLQCLDPGGTGMFGAAKPTATTTHCAL